MTSIWMRVGMSIQFTDEELEALLTNKKAGKKAILAAIKNGRFTVSGDTYAPVETLEDDLFETDYDVNEMLHGDDILAFDM